MELTCDFHFTLSLLPICLLTFKISFIGMGFNTSICYVQVGERIWRKDKPKINWMNTVRWWNIGLSRLQVRNWRWDYTLNVMRLTSMSSGILRWGGNFSRRLAILFAVARYDAYLLIISSLLPAWVCSLDPSLIELNAGMALKRESVGVEVSLSAFFLKLQLPVFQLKWYRGRKRWP